MTSPFEGKRQRVGAIPAAAPRYGLLTAANVIDEPERWEPYGETWVPEGYRTGQTRAYDCNGAMWDGGIFNSTDQGAAQAESADPFLLQTYDKASTIGWSQRDFLGRANRMMIADQSRLIASEFWRGDRTREADLINPYLAQSETTSPVSSSPCSVVTGLAFLEEAIAITCGGRRGMIHITPQLMMHAHAAYALELQGQVWTTPMGTIVVADAGYDGSGPDTRSNGPGTPGSSQWGYATAMVEVQLGPIDIVPGTLDAARAQAIDRSNNTVEIFATRPALIKRDVSTPWTFACEFDVPLAGLFT